jgi:hypothetical protein
MLAEVYDQFIFQELGRGAAVGTALHYIFEILDFNQPETWAATLEKVQGIYSNILKEGCLLILPIKKIYTVELSSRHIFCFDYQLTSR